MPTPSKRLASRDTALEQLATFLQDVTRYGARRNFVDERNSSVSQLSPYIRRRVVLEDEVIERTLERYPFAKVEKFIQEVVWRTYWKGWLHGRPWVWKEYLRELAELDSALCSDASSGASASLVNRDAYYRAVGGETQFDYFNVWVRELKDTGYLHNHVRMWFASIWIFTLALPWQLGAQFFLSHLLDGDAAVNTLSWRWVAGLQTSGKHYVATASNIRRYTEQRWEPAESDLETQVAPMVEVITLARAPLPFSGLSVPSIPEGSALLIHAEDLCPEHGAIPPSKFQHIIAFCPKNSWEGHHPSVVVEKFVESIFEDAIRRVENRYKLNVERVTDVLGCAEAASRAKLRSIFCYRAHVGFLEPVLNDLAQCLSSQGVALQFIDREHDQELFPYASRGFFPYWEKVSKVMKGRAS